MNERLPAEWIAAMELPLIVAPMFLVSSVDLVAAACESGVISAMPTVNARTPAILEEWLEVLTRRLANTRNPPPWALNLIVHRTNVRLKDDLTACIKYRAPLVITALGSPRDVVPAIHAYGGKVFADVISLDQARKAAESNVDGLVLVCSGAGGHTGQFVAPGFVAAVREFWTGIIVVAGGLANGRDLRAMQLLGADLAYMGTRFIASEESNADPRYKQMVVDCSFTDIICTNAITGAYANKLRPSLEAVGLDPNNLKPRQSGFDLNYAERQPKAWKDIWSAGHGLGQIKSLESTATIINVLRKEFQAAIAAELADPWMARYCAARTGE